MTDFLFFVFHITMVVANTTVIAFLPNWVSPYALIWSAGWATFHGIRVIRRDRSLNR
jgi:hypothetical protein